MRPWNGIGTYFYFAIFFSLFFFLSRGGLFFFWLRIFKFFYQERCRIPFCGCAIAESKLVVCLDRYLEMINEFKGYLVFNNHEFRGTLRIFDLSGLEWPDKNLIHDPLTFNSFQHRIWRLKNTDSFLDRFLILYYLVCFSDWVNQLLTTPSRPPSKVQLKDRWRVSWSTPKSRWCRLTSSARQLRLFSTLPLVSSWARLLSNWFRGAYFLMIWNEILQEKVDFFRRIYSFFFLCGRANENKIDPYLDHTNWKFQKLVVGAFIAGLCPINIMYPKTLSPIFLLMSISMGWNVI